MPMAYCGGCSNHVDPKTAIRWVKPGGRAVYFCSEECKVVGEGIEPPVEWAATPKAAIRDEKKAKKETLKRAKRAKPAKRAAKRGKAAKRAKPAPKRRAK